MDYCDLDFLHNYFEFDKVNEGKYILKSKYPEQRAAIIEAAWDSYRRHILYALPILVDAARNTIVSSEINWEKFGNQQRRTAIRQAIGGAISDIGIHSLETVEHTLLEFAAVSEITLQRITAKAMARWREYGHHELLFNTINRWVISEDIQQTVTEFLKNEKISSINKSSAEKALTYIKSTSVLTLGYAAAYDPPDELDQRLIDLLQLLLVDYEPRVRERLKEVLPRLIKQHVHKMLPLITEHLVKEDDLQELVSNSLAGVYLEFPETIQKILIGWIQECLEVNSEENRRLKLTHRDKVLITVLKTYQKLDLIKSQHVISIQSLYQTLKSLIKLEKREAVLKVVWETLIFVLQLDYEEAERQLPEICPNVFSEEADYLVFAFCKVYFQERIKLNELTVYRLKLALEEEKLPVWLNPNERPVTKVEKGVQQLLESKVLSNRLLGTKILWQFGKEVDKEELDNLFRIEPIRPIERPQNSQRERETPTTASIHFNRAIPIQISMWIRIWIYILCIKDDNSLKSRETLKAFYLTIKSKGLKSAYTSFLLKRWSGGLPELKKMSSRIQFLIKRAF